MKVAIQQVSLMAALAGEIRAHILNQQHLAESVH